MTGDLPARFGKGLIWNYLGRIGEFGIRFLFVSLVAKRLGPDEFGVYSFAYSIFVAGTLVGALGYEQALNNFIPAFLDDQGKQAFLLRRILALRALVMAVLTLAGALLSPLLSQWAGPVASAVVWALPYLFWFNIANLLAYFWVGRLDVRLVSIVRVVVQAANYAATWWLLGRGYGPQAILLLMGCTAALAAIAYLLHTARFLRGPQTPLPMGRIHRFAVNLGITNGLNYVLGQQSDVALIGLLLRDSAQIGFYNLAATLNMVAGTALLIGMEGVSQSALAEVASRGMRDLAVTWRAFMKLTMLFSAPVLAFCALHADKLLAFYGMEYANAVSLLRVYLGFTLASRFLGGGTNTATLYAIRKEQWPLGIRAATGALNVALAIAFISFWGALGAVVATGIALVLTVGTETIVTVKETGAVYPIRFALAVTGCTALSAAISYPLTGVGLWGLAAGAGVFLAVFLVGFVLARPLEPEDQAYLARMLPAADRWVRRLVRG